MIGVGVFPSFKKKGGVSTLNLFTLWHIHCYYVILYCVNTVKRGCCVPFLPIGGNTECYTDHHGSQALVKLWVGGGFQTFDVPVHTYIARDTTWQSVDSSFIEQREADNLHGLLCNFLATGLPFHTASKISSCSLTLP